MALLRSGQALYPELGCAGLSVRRVAQHADVNPAMFHYHFKSKQVFLRALLQQIYDEMFGQLQASERRGGPALERLRAALTSFAMFVREHQAMISRLMLDAASGEAVVREFLRANFPRHFGLLMALLAEAQAEGAVREGAVLQAFAFMMGAVATPLLAASAAARLQLGPPEWSAQLGHEVMSDEAIAERIAMVLGALAVAVPSSSPKRKTT